jgi:hypothetical protein
VLNQYSEIVWILLYFQAIFFSSKIKLSERFFFEEYSEILWILMGFLVLFLSLLDLNLILNFSIHLNWYQYLSKHILNFSLHLNINISLPIHIFKFLYLLWELIYSMIHETDISRVKILLLVILTIIDWENHMYDL